MAKKTLKKAKWFWQDYPGTNWNNVRAANSGEEGLAAYVYPKGSKPRSLFYHYQFSGVDSSKYKLDKVEFVLYIGKFKESENDLPTIKVYTGDNNAPYKTNPIKKVSSATRRANPAAWDTYSLAFNITGVTFSQLKNLIIEVDWKKSKVAYQSVISVNRGRLEVNYSLKAPKWTLQNVLSKYSAPVNEKVGWKLIAKNGGECGSGKVQLQLPKGMAVDGTSGGGSYNAASMVWSYNACKGESVERVFYLKSSSAGVKKVKAINDSSYATNASITREITFEKYEPPVPIGNNRDDVIIYTFYDTFAKEQNQYFDVQIQGMKENHATGIACYTFTTSNNVQLNTPLRSNVELIDVNSNVQGIVTTSSVTHNGVTVSVANNTVCLIITDAEEDFIANVRVYMYCTNDNQGTITIAANDKTYAQSFDIMAARNNIFLTDSAISRDKQYVLNSINIGVPNIWTIRATSSRHNFYDEKASDFMIDIEKMIAYIGPVPIQRPHSRDVKANTTNTLINNTYLNRKYLGKTGDTEEDIPMTLRMKWQDVVTLQGLAAMDKPVPIDLIPELPDGDPVNHRGWAELYAVKNIRKVNDLLYECEPEVDYLTHALLTKFRIEEKGNLTDNKIDYFLSETCTYNDNLLERFNINYSQFWTNVEDEQGNVTGYYELEPLTNLTLNSIDSLKDHSNYNIRFRNELPALMSEDYDKNWEMAIRIRNRDNRDEVLFEHSYNNFKHYDFTNGVVMNTADVTSKLLQGDKMNIINFDNMVLGYDNLAPLLEDSKIATHFSTLDNATFNDDNNSLELYLLDINDVGIINEQVEIRITNAEGYAERFNVLTDRFGRFGLNIHLENGKYALECIHNVTNIYKGSTYSKEITIAYDNTDTVFTYANDFVTFDTNLMYEATLKTAAGTALSGKMVSYAFRDLSSEYYGHEETLLTNSSGKVKIPIAYNNGSKELKVTFKGDGTYNPCFFEDIIDINIQGENAVIESDDVELVQGDALKEYHIILKDDEGNTLANKPITISFYKQDESYVLETTTNEYGVAKQPIYLNKGAWNVDTIFKGDSTYKPAVNTNEILVKEYIQLETKLLSENVILDESEIMAGNQDYYTLTLLDENDRPVENEPISIIIFNNDKTEKYVDVVLETDDTGILEVPFVSHNETVIIDAIYYGCNKYDGCSKTERVSFEQNHVKNDVTFFVNSNTGEINLTEGTYTDHVLTGTFDGKYDIIVNNPNNDRICNIGANYLASLDDGTYNVTFVYYGTDNYYPTMITIEWEHGNDTRFSSFDNFISMQGADNEDFDYLLVPTMAVGKLNHMKVMFYYEVPRTIIYIAVGYSSNSTPNSLSDLTNNSDYVVAAVPKRWKSSLGTGRSYIEFDFIEPANRRIGIWIPPTDHTFAKWSSSTYASPGTTTLRNAIITQSGFGNLGETYQDFTVSVTGASAAADENINPYLIAKLVNLNTFEELYYYSFLINQMTITELQFLLEKGDWALNIVSKDSSSYKGASYATTATISTDTPLLTASLDPLFDYDNWIDKGTVSIESYLDGTQEKITNIQTATNALHSVLNYELTDSTDYKLSFKWGVNYSSEYNQVYFGINIDADDNLDGIWVRPDKVEEYKDNVLINSTTFSGNYSSYIDTIDVTVRRKGNQYAIYFGNDLMYVSENAAHNNFGAYAIGQGGAEGFTQFHLHDVLPVITPPIIDGSLNNEIFGSDLQIEIKKNRLSLTDYGMLPDGELQNGKVILNNIQLKEGTYELEIDINYNNSRFERLNNLNGLIEMNIFEDISLTDGALKYANILCSPVPVMNSITKFTRKCDEGTMYYIEKPKEDNAKYLCNPYIQYKGGTDLKTSTGISIFNLDNAYSPVALSNGLVKAEFHRRSGYIVISRYDETTELWHRCNTFKISNEPNLSLEENYSDDKATVRFGNTKWTMWRGRPFIKLEHSDTDIRILGLVDRVYCETMQNEFSMGFVEEHNTYMSIFNPRLSIQQFKEEWHIGEDMRLDNFNLYSMTLSNSKYYIGDLQDTGMELVDFDNEKAIQITKQSATRLGLNFPASPTYVAKPGSTFSLLIDNISTVSNKSIVIKARGFDERGCVHAVEGIEYGIWEQQKTVQVNSCNWILDGSYSSESLDSCESYLMRGNPTVSFSDSLRVTFTGCPEEVKYIDFLVIFPSYDDTIRIKNIMLYEGSDTGLRHDVDTSKANASLVEINFDETYYACLYDENSLSGLAIVRPDKKKFGLRTLEASAETILIPYMKKYVDHDAVENVMLEYFNSKNQIINVDWEG